MMARPKVLFTELDCGLFGITRKMRNGVESKSLPTPTARTLIKVRSSRTQGLEWGMQVWENNDVKT